MVCLVEVFATQTTVFYSSLIELQTPIPSEMGSFFSTIFRSAVVCFCLRKQNLCYRTVLIEYIVYLLIKETK